MWEKCKVVMLPINEKANLKSDLAINENNLLFQPSKLEGTWFFLNKYQHLYILSDEEIKEGDWTIAGDDEIWKAKRGDILEEEIHGKIIATTDKSLVTKGECNCFATTYEGCSECLNLLPQIPQSFIEHYVTEYNKGNIITSIHVASDSVKYSLDEVKGFMLQAYNLGKSLSNPLEDLYSKLF